MIDYSCRLTERFLHRALADPGYLTMANVRRDYLAGPAGDGDLPVPFNRVMIATFYLTGMDIAHRLIGWLDAVAAGYLGGKARDLVPYVVVLAILVVRPYGIFGTRTIERL